MALSQTDDPASLLGRTAISDGVIGTREIFECNHPFPEDRHIGNGIKRAYEDATKGDDGSTGVSRCALQS